MMKSAALVFIVSSALLFVAGEALAQTATPTVTPVGSPTPTQTPEYLKWSQLPDMSYGYNIESMNLTDTVVADDWECTDGAPLKIIRWWGSYIGYSEDSPAPVPPPPVRPNAFILSWHDYVPGPPYSMPGALRGQEYCTVFTEEWYGAVPKWDEPGKYEHEFLYEQELDSYWLQNQGEYYFLNIQAVYLSPTATITATITQTPTGPTPTLTPTPTGPTPTPTVTPTGPTPTPTPTVFPWGWKISRQHWNDDAVQSTDGGNSWEELRYPTPHPTYPASVDMAFELYNVPTPTTSPTQTSTYTPTLTPSPTATMGGTITRTPSYTPTNTPTPTMANTPSSTPTRTPTVTTTPTITRTPTITSTPTISPTSIPTATPTVTLTPTITPTGVPKLAIMKKEGVNDTNLYYYNSIEIGDWVYWDAVARNPSALARDFWAIPVGNDAIGVAAVREGIPNNLYVLKKEGAVDVNLYLYNSILAGDWVYWDAVARNPSPLARDLWVISVGNDAIGMAAVEITGGGRDELAILKREGANDLNIYYYNALELGDWTYWDALARNPSPLARDLWSIPVGNDAVGLSAIDAGDGGEKELAIIRKEGANDLNLYYYNNLDPGDWTYWDAISRNPSPLARDLWAIPVGNDSIGMAAIDTDGDGYDELAILKKEGAGDVNIYFYNGLEAGDWVYWDAVARNPSPLARDLWAIPVGNDAVGMAAIRVGGQPSPVSTPTITPALTPTNTPTPTKTATMTFTPTVTPT